MSGSRTSAGAGRSDLAECESGAQALRAAGRLSPRHPSDRGLIRAARRPPGWTPAGPQPHGPGTRSDLWPGQHEDLCYLSGDWRIFQRIDGHRWSLDDLVTAAYAVDAARQYTVRRVLDLGCGIGSVLLMVAWSLPAAEILGVEAQSISIDLARRSIAYNGVATRCAVRPGDFREPGVISGQSEFDLVTGTPPYFDRETGPISNHVQRGPCRFEVRGGVEAYCRAAAEWLGREGCFVFCVSSGQEGRVDRACRESGLSLMAGQEVIPRVGKPPLFTVYRLSRAAIVNKAAARWDPPLIVRDTKGRRTPQFISLREKMGMPS